MTQVVVNGGGGGGSGSYQGLITIWIAAYIPQSKFIIIPPGLPTPPDYVPKPGIAGSGDDRGPSGGNGGSSRIWGYAKFTVDRDGTLTRQNQTWGVGESTVLIKESPFFGSWEPLVSKCTDPRPHSDLSTRTSGNKASVSMSADIPNGILDKSLEYIPDGALERIPEDLISASITYNLDIEVEISGNEITASVEGKHNEYPAYEVYVGDYLVHHYDDTEGIGGIEPGASRLARGLNSTKRVSVKENKNTGGFTPGISPVRLPDECRQLR